ncbi:hypothetical protein SNA_38515 [Streptomyces natalensis ATCC 27448]|uniref:Uncharacterized protein n=1 Tax=Streptomyces natalensis ATCC 27448 TaxID=1240678 RepID=A0A0D7CDD9_9ACTN|nr:hypothetical protein SNA_38515 [Streptomyces natalensis ATCC 27448]
MDVVRAQHLHRTGRPVPEGAQRRGRRFVVESIDLPARPACRDGGPGRRAAGTEAPWFAGDDPLPFFMMLASS